MAKEELIGGVVYHYCNHGSGTDGSGQEAHAAWGGRACHRLGIIRHGVINP